MIPLSDGIPARRFPVVTVAIIVANVLVWTLYELPHLGPSIHHASLYPCAVDGACHSPEPWPVSLVTSMFLHGGWDHLLGNMLFLAVFGKNVEDAFGRGGFLAFYLAGGLVASAAQTAMTLTFGSAAAAQVPVLGASGAIAAVLGAYFVLHPTSRVLTLLVVVPVRIPAFAYLGLWFAYQVAGAHDGLLSSGGGTAFFAHVAGFLFGVLVARAHERRASRTPARPAAPAAALRS
jgi:rhomboid family protein